MELGVARCRFLEDWKIFLWKHIALRITRLSLLSIHAAMPLLSEKTSSISPQLILQLCEIIKPSRWLLIGQLVVRIAIFLWTNRIAYVERMAYVLIPRTGLGTVASARTVTVGTHTSNMVVKVFNLVTTNLQQFFQKK